MKKGEVYSGIVDRVEFPNKGIVIVHEEDENAVISINRAVVKNTIPGQKISFVVNKKRKDKCEGRLIQVLEKSPIETIEACKHFGVCGGCVYQTVAYEEQLKIKSDQVKKMLDEVITKEYEFEGIKGSPRIEGYRNKMEFSFGDELKDGPLALGMHKRNSTYDIVTVDSCQIVDEDYRKVLNCVFEYFKSANVPFFHKMTHIGYLRHLLVRKAVYTGEILIDLVTTTQMELDLNPLAKELQSLELDGKIVGLLHTFNDSVADVVRNDRTDIVYGQDFFHEKLLGLSFKITPFSFFQTNSMGAEVLYETAREYVGATADKVIFDLYSGTGTIAQMLAPVAKKVVGVEIVEEAVESAKANAKLNGLSNCEFIAGDVLKVIGNITDKPDLIVLDPPRDGIHPKALDMIIKYGVDRLVYISCKPTSLARDLVVLQEKGYEVEKVCCVDMFPGTGHVETVVLLRRQDM